MEEGRLHRLVSGTWFFRVHIISQVNTALQGMEAQITKAVLSQALLFMSKEQFEHWALAIMILFARFSARQQ